MLAVAAMAVFLPAAAGADACSNAAFRVGSSAHLPDCRAYEQVSPTIKNGLDAIPDIEEEPGFVGGFFPAQASQAEGVSGETSFAYQSSGAFAGTEANELPNAYIATRRDGEWQTQAIAPPTPQPTLAAVFFLSYDFGPDLSQVVVSTPLQRLPEGTSDEVVNLYHREIPEGSYSLVSAPPLINPPTGCVVCIHKHERAFSGASGNFQHVLFEAMETLLPGAPEGVESLYENADGQIRLVGILPDGTVAQGPSAAGAGLEVSYSSSFGRFRASDVNHAISQDGARVFFKAGADEGIPDPAQKMGMTELYERVEGSKTVEISAPAKGATPENPTAEPAQFWAASTDGELVFFTTSAELTTQSNTGPANAGQDLYRYNTKTEELVDLTVDDSDKSTGAGVLGVAGASEDGAYVYFVAAGQLVNGQGIDGQPNLYLSHENQQTHAREISFIATLNNADERVWTSVPASSESYVTPDGLHLAFMSVNSLTGYDNEDQNIKEQLDSEVYEYGATVNQANGQLEDGQLVCASCDPSGRRPVGGAFTGVLIMHETSNTPFYQHRVLSDDGRRLFFSSPDPLVPGLSAGSHTAIFEYENGGVQLIASPSTGTNDLFLDASPSGNDVFFATRDQLTPSDKDNLVDIYDARVEGGLPTAEPPPQCGGSACQGPPSVAPALPIDTSALFSGSGNLMATPAAPSTKLSSSKKRKSARSKKSRGRHTQSRIKRHARTGRHSSVLKRR